MSTYPYMHPLHLCISSGEARQNPHSACWGITQAARHQYLVHQYSQNMSAFGHSFRFATFLPPSCSGNFIACSSPYMIYIVYSCIMSVCRAINECLVKCPRGSDQLGTFETLCHTHVLLAYYHPGRLSLHILAFYMVKSIYFKVGEQGEVKRHMKAVKKCLKKVRRLSKHIESTK